MHKRGVDGENVEAWPRLRRPRERGGKGREGKKGGREGGRDRRRAMYVPFQQLAETRERPIC